MENVKHKKIIQNLIIIDDNDEKKNINKTLISDLYYKDKKDWVKKTTLDPGYHLNLPDSPGVYFIWNNDQNEEKGFLYIGSASSLRNRHKNHNRIKDFLASKSEGLFGFSYSLEICRTEGENNIHPLILEAILKQAILADEQHWIEYYQPPMNKQILKIV